MLHAPLIVHAQAAGPRWERIAMRTPAQATAGFAGGEGGQWPRGIVYSRDGARALLCIDVAGAYLSEDSGVTWNVRSNGYSARGCASAAFDPGNSDRIVAVGANSAPHEANGLYLTEDGARSWRQVRSAMISGLSEQRQQIAWDETTWDPTARKTRTVYWSRVESDAASWGTPEERPALWRSDDGGVNWTELPNSKEAAGGAFLRALGGKLYAANRRGVFVSSDKGLTFSKKLDGECTGFALAGTEMLALQPQRLRKSTDGGSTWNDVNIGPIKNGTDVFRYVEVSPADPNKVALWRESVPNTWTWPRFVSSNGGASWSQVTMQTPEAFLPVNSRQGLWAWHPTDANVALSIGGDIVTRSTDGGRTLGWSNTGNNAIFIGGHFNFNAKDPDVMFFGSQDYNGAATKDGGRSWIYQNPAGNGWGGFTYAGYALSKDVYAVGDAPSWGGPRKLKITRDGGTWTDASVDLTGAYETSIGSPMKPNVAFVKEARTTDGGRTWKRMTACDGVFATAGSALFGAKKLGENRHQVVRSTDLGKTWTAQGTPLGEIRDLAYDPRGGRLYAVDSGEVKLLGKRGWTVLDTPRDQYGSRVVRSVAVDPRDPSKVYLGSAANVYATSKPVMRSTDSGATWTVISEPTPLLAGKLDGGREAVCVRVHPKTGHLWVATSCYGFWRFIP